MGQIEHHEHDGGRPHDRNPHSRLSRREGRDHEPEQHHPGHHQPQQPEEALAAGDDQHRHHEQDREDRQDRDPVNRDQRPSPGHPLGGADLGHVDAVAGLQAAPRGHSHQLHVHEFARPAVEFDLGDEAGVLDAGVRPGRRGVRGRRARLDRGDLPAHGHDPLGRQHRTLRQHPFRGPQPHQARHGDRRHDGQQH